MPHTAPVPSTPSNIPRLAFGGAVFGREIDEDSSRRLLDHAMARGMTLIDTAEAYGGGNARLARQRGRPRPICEGVLAGAKGIPLSARV